MSDVSYLTPEGKDRLQAELTELRGPGREALAARLRAAIQMGDLSENADYHAAKEEQAFMEGRIQELERTLKNVKIIDEKSPKGDLINIGSRITIQEGAEDPEDWFIVGPKEANPRSGMISHDSPIGKSLLGHKVGDLIEVLTPGGSISIKVLAIK